MITLGLFILLFLCIVFACLSVSVALLWEVLKLAAIIAAIVFIVRYIQNKRGEV